MKVDFINGVAYLGDSLEILQEFDPSNKFDLCLTDPPYGIGESNKKNLSRNRKTDVNPNTIDYPDFEDVKPNKNIFDLILQLSHNQIIWGGNYFSDYLPSKMGWIFWDKLRTGDLSDGELAWTSYNKALRKFTFQWNGWAKDGDRSINNRIHLTQKPYELMLYCFEYAKLPEFTTVLDPFAGSGTTAIACIRSNRRFVVIEKEQKYFDLMCKRIEYEEMQYKLNFDADLQKVG